MTSRSDLARGLLRSACGQFDANVAALTLEEALYAAGGYRSILGSIKHLGGWLHVYRAYAFDTEPKHWRDTSWPRGLRDEVDVSREYLDEVIAWVGQGHDDWDANLAATTDEDFDGARPVHWGDRIPLFDIVTIVASHTAYHTGELNMLLSIARGEAWEWGEEVEENHIDTFGHGIRGPWMTDEIAKHYEDELRAARERRTGAAS